MAVTYGFYSSVNHDRKYNAEQISRIFDGVIQDGVYLSIGNQFAITPAANLQVIVQSGRAWFNHTWLYNDSNLYLTLGTADPFLKRIDAIVIEVDSTPTVRRSAIKVVPGTPSSAGTKPTLTNTALIHQYAIGYVTVAGGATSLTAADIEYTVGKSPCPYVTSVLEKTDITPVWNQWKAQFDQLMSQKSTAFDKMQTQKSTNFDTMQNQKSTAFDTMQQECQDDFDTMMTTNDTAFQEWFANLKLQLTEDVVTNLQNQIDELGLNKVNVDDLATADEAKAGTDNTKWMSPLRTHEHYLAWKATSYSDTNSNHWTTNSYVNTKFANTVFQTKQPYVQTELYMFDCRPSSGSTLTKSILRNPTGSATLNVTATQAGTITLLLFDTPSGTIIFCGNPSNALDLYLIGRESGYDSFPKCYRYSGSDFPISMTACVIMPIIVHGGVKDGVSNSTITTIREFDTYFNNSSAYRSYFFGIKVGSYWSVAVVDFYNNDYTTYQANKKLMLRFIKKNLSTSLSMSTTFNCYCFWLRGMVQSSTSLTYNSTTKYCTGRIQYSSEKTSSSRYFDWNTTSPTMFYLRRSTSGSAITTPTNPLGGNYVLKEMKANGSYPSDGQREKAHFDNNVVIYRSISYTNNTNVRYFDVTLVPKQFGYTTSTAVESSVNSDIIYNYEVTVSRYDLSDIFPYVSSGFSMITISNFHGDIILHSCGIILIFGYNMTQAYFVCISWASFSSALMTGSLYPSFSVKANYPTNSIGTYGLPFALRSIFLQNNSNIAVKELSLSMHSPNFNGYISFESNILTDYPTESYSDFDVLDLEDYGMFYSESGLMSVNNISMNSTISWSIHHASPLLSPPRRYTKYTNDANVAIRKPSTMLVKWELPEKTTLTDNVKHGVQVVKDRRLRYKTILNIGSLSLARRCMVLYDEETSSISFSMFETKKKKLQG